MSDTRHDLLKRALGMTADFDSFIGLLYVLADWFDPWASVALDCSPPPLISEAHG